MTKDSVLLCWLSLLLVLPWMMTRTVEAFSLMSTITASRASSARALPSIHFLNDDRLYHGILSSKTTRGAVNRTPSTTISTPTILLPSTTRLFSTKNSDSSSDDDDDKKKMNIFRRFRQFWVTRITRFTTKYQALSKRAKRIVMAQFLVIAIVLGGMGRAAVVNSPSAARRAPIEIAYSSFLDLVEQQSSPANNDVPVLDHVRIGNDRISYRLYRRTTAEDEAESSSRSSPNHSIRAYTRKVSASPELLQSLRSNKITFGALTQPRVSAVAMITRTVLVGFYCMILWRLYGTVARAGGNSKSDTPGKLASASDLPLATFDEIQGIDAAKNEVMELVDALRNPDKYAILGARAPTGLLLEGPPGVGKTLLVRFEFVFLRFVCVPVDLPYTHWFVIFSLFAGPRHGRFGGCASLVL